MQEDRSEFEVRSTWVLSAVLTGWLASGSVAETIALPDGGWNAVSAFRDTCLKSRSAGVEAAIAEILARPGVKEGASLPSYGSGRPMRRFLEGKREYLIRYGKGKKFGCLVALPDSSELGGSAKAAISALEGLQIKPAKPGKKLFYEWTIRGSKDEIRLTPNSDIGSLLINLEVN